MTTKEAIVVRYVELDALRTEVAHLRAERHRVREQALLEARDAIKRLANWAYHGTEPAHPTCILDRTADLLFDLSLGKITGASYRLTAARNP